MVVDSFQSDVLPSESKGNHLLRHGTMVCCIWNVAQFLLVRSIVLFDASTIRARERYDEIGQDVVSIDRPSIERRRWNPAMHVCSRWDRSRERTSATLRLQTLHPSVPAVVGMSFPSSCVQNHSHNLALHPKIRHRLKLRSYGSHGYEIRIARVSKQVHRQKERISIEGQTRILRMVIVPDTFFFFLNIRSKGRSHGPVPRVGMVRIDPHMTRT